jgi:tripeptidyl-peptidase-2
MQVALTCDDTWIECPKHIYMVNGAKQFTVRINLDELCEGKFYYTQIKAYDIENLSKSCIFKIPVTIIKPIK